MLSTADLILVVKYIKMLPESEILKNCMHSNKLKNYLYFYSGLMLFKFRISLVEFKPRITAPICVGF